MKSRALSLALVSVALSAASRPPDGGAWSKAFGPTYWRYWHAAKAASAWASISPAPIERFYGLHP